MYEFKLIKLHAFLDQANVNVTLVRRKIYIRNKKVLINMHKMFEIQRAKMNIPKPKG